jgi:hypothetical protein
MEFLKKIILGVGLVSSFTQIANSMHKHQDADVVERAKSQKSSICLKPKSHGIHKHQARQEPSTILKAFMSRNVEVINRLSEKIDAAEIKDLKQQAVAELLSALNPNNFSTVNQLRDCLEQFLRKMTELKNLDSETSNLCVQMRSLLGELNKQFGTIEVKKVVLDKQNQPQQDSTFWQKHGNKLIIGGIVVLGIVVGGVLIAKLGIPAYLISKASDVVKKCADCVMTVAKTSADLVPVTQPMCPVQPVCEAVKVAPKLIASGQEIANQSTAVSSVLKNCHDHIGALKVNRKFFITLLDYAHCGLKGLKDLF